MTLWIVGRQTPLSVEFSRWEQWVAVPSSGDTPDSRVEPVSLALAGRFFTPSGTWEAPLELKWLSKQARTSIKKYPSWRRKWQPTSIFLPGKSHGERSLTGYSPWVHKVRHDLVSKQQQLVSLQKNVRSWIFQKERNDNIIYQWKNCESLHYTPVAYIILHVDYTS